MLCNFSDWLIEYICIYVHVNNPCLIVYFIESLVL
jgi:hypothetical protein